MKKLPRAVLLLPVLVVASLSLAMGPCSGHPGGGLPFFRFEAPLPGQLSQVGPLGFELRLPPHPKQANLVIELDGQPLDPSSFERGRRQVSGPLPPLGPGAHELRASIELRPVPFLPARVLHAAAAFELVQLENPEECEILSRADCLLPYPSSRFQAPAETPTGWRLAFPVAGMPLQFGRPISPDMLGQLDGFSPLVQVLMNFPGGVDLERSGAAQLLSDRRTHDDRSLDRNSPTVLVDLETGERVLHFVELDARLTDPARRLFFLRPAQSLRPGHRYAVAVRNLVAPDGSPVPAEPVFAALRDGRPSDIPAVEARREHFEHLFRDLWRKARVPRGDLVLAFDFVVQSDEGLTHQMLAMREQAFDWLAQQVALGNTADLFTVNPDATRENDCSEPDTLFWRTVEGTYRVPLFLTADPVATPRADSFLAVDADGHPVPNGETNPPFTIAVPCAVLQGGPPASPLVIGHGLFGSGRSTIRGFLDDEVADGVLDLGFDRFDYIPGATDWRGLSTPDREGPPGPDGRPGPLVQSWIVTQVLTQLGNFSQLPDRLRQGQLNTLVLARMMKQGLFNVHPAFRTPEDAGVFPGPQEPAYYFGASLGGVMGLMFAALSPDVERLNVDVPAMNFAFLLQRATPFLQFQDLLVLTGIGDATEVAIGVGLIGELWVRGESAGYATHITRDPLPGTNAKRILMTEAWLDQQVSNLGTEIAARTLRLPNLKPGSLVSDLVDVPDRAGPLPSALVVYDTGSFDLANPAHEPFVPPLANLQAIPNRCDPHGLRGLIPASLLQLIAFLQPDGEIENFCNGDCDAAEPIELPFGADAPCNPLP